MKVVFFGTPAFAVPTLATLYASDWRPGLVVSQPARRVGRGRRVEDPPVAAWARAHDLAVEQPEKVRDAAFLESLETRGPDVAVVVAFGQIFPRRLLGIPRLGCVNLHASLLPRHRGAAPIQAAIVHGDTETGVCTMLMEAGLDTGPVLLSERCPIADTDDAPALSERLAILGAGLVLPTLEGLAAGSLRPRPQDTSQVTVAPRLSRQDGLLDWSEDATTLWRKSRAYRPWPGLVCRCRGERLELHQTRVLEDAATDGAAPGTLLGVAGDVLAVAAGRGSVIGLLTVQRPGRVPVSGADLARGLGLRVGAVEFEGLDPRS